MRLVLLIVVAMAASTNVSRAQVPQPFFDACVAILEAFGQTRSECGPTPTDSRPRPRSSGEPSGGHGQHFVFQLPSDHDLFEASDAVGQVNVVADGQNLQCPVAMVAPGRLLTTARCGRAIDAQRRSNRDVAFRLGFRQWTVTKNVVVRPPESRVVNVAISVDIDPDANDDFSLLSFDGKANGQTKSLQIAPRSPVAGDRVTLLSWDNGVLRMNCQVDGPAREGSDQLALVCEKRSGTVRLASNSLVFLRGTYTLVGSIVDDANTERPTFTSVRAYALQPEISGTLVGDARRVLGCFTAGHGNKTIRDMFDCSGVWVTPRALLRCSMGTDCPVLRDTIVDRAALEAVLSAEGLTIDSKLMLRPQDLPGRPSAATIEACKAGGRDAAAFATCAMADVASPQLKKLQDCLRGADAAASAVCLTDETKDEKLRSVLGCLSGKDASAQAVIACAQDAGTQAKIAEVQRCASSAGSPTETAKCLLSEATAPQQAVAGCVAGAGRGSEVAACLDNLSPEFANARRVTQCLEGARSERAALSDAAACVRGVLPGETGRIAGCLSNPDRETAALCVLGDNKEAAAAGRVYRCVSRGRDAASVIENCTSGLGLEPKTPQSLACIARAGSDKGKLVGCAAQTALPPEAARMVGCAATSQGPTSFALCASGPMMNEEWRIAAECAVQSGGQPYATAACAATRLTIRELTACFTGKVGVNCFGPNNTIVKTITNAFDDLLHGPGKNNEVVKAVAAINEGVQKLTEEGRKFAERPLGGDQALIPKARDDLLNALHIGGTGRKVIEDPFRPWKWF